MIARQTLHGNGSLCGRILDEVAFVQDAVVPTRLRKNINVVAADLIGRDDDISRVKLVPDARSFARWTDVSDCSQKGCVVAYLMLPVA